MDLLKYITEKMLILIPVLYIIGMIIKGTEKIKNKYIPVIPVSYTHLDVYKRQYI